MTERILTERTQWEGAKLRVLERDLRLDNGQEVTWEVIDKPDSVAVVPVNDGEVHLLRQYFGARDEWGLTLPKGGIEGDETPEAAAKRELREETGLVGPLEELTAVSVSPGYLTQVTTIFLGRDLEAHPDGRIEDAEEPMEVVRLPLEEALERVLAKEVSQARTVAGLALATQALP